VEEEETLKVLLWNQEEIAPWKPGEEGGAVMVGSGMCCRKLTSVKAKTDRPP